MAELGEAIERLEARQCLVEQCTGQLCKDDALILAALKAGQEWADDTPLGEVIERLNEGGLDGECYPLIHVTPDDFRVILAALQAGQEYVEAKLDYDDICQRNGAAYHECGQIPEEWETDESKAAERRANAEAALLAAYGKE